MTVLVARAASAELLKLYGLPAVRAVVAGAVVAAAVLAWVVAGASACLCDPTRSCVLDVLGRTIPLLQVGPALVGVLAVATEYEGRQLLTTLSAIPARVRLLVGKTLAAAAALLGLAVASCGALLVAAAVTASRRTHCPTTVSDGIHLAGAVAYLVLIGLLSLAVTVVLRTLVASLTATLTYLLVVSPLAAGWTEHASWLPDQAGRLLYSTGTDPLLTPTTGGLTLLGWTAVAGAVATVTFARRDA